MVKVEGVTVEGDATSIPKDFEKKTTEHTDPEPPCTVFPDKTALSYQEDSENNEVRQITSICWDVFDLRIVERADVQCAIVLGDECAIQCWNPEGSIDDFGHLEVVKICDKMRSSRAGL